jgi:hypothetical protein
MEKKERNKAALNGAIAILIIIVIGAVIGASTEFYITSVIMGGCR